MPAAENSRSLAALDAGTAKYALIVCGIDCANCSTDWLVPDTLAAAVRQNASTSIDFCGFVNDVRAAINSARRRLRVASITVAMRLQQREWTV
jgi:hypothetical protein